ncbi:tyrosine-type recombinase/integrase [Aliiroseovarius sp. YM-037]|uniref:tyrosine-type recombinase/integrase n=1 Tax=Aliiroseovarius sp. YM-037 TaxID=3341728 RepID=UPI003A8103E3
MNANWRPDLSDQDVVLSLSARKSPYFNILSYCRHVGLEVKRDRVGYWVARVRRRDGGYSQRRLCQAFRARRLTADFHEAVKLAEIWFSTREVVAVAAEPYQVGSKRDLSICPICREYTVGHALKEYLEWKVLAASRSHFETLVSLINYHLVPRVSHIPIAEFDGNAFHKLAVDVLETPPKRSKNVATSRLNIRSMSQDQLRKRKKTFNALVSILRGAFELAWERRHLENDHPMRCLRRLPNVDRPRIIFLDRAECHLLLEKCNIDLRQLVTAALYTGCRANELIAMSAKDFSEHTRSLFVASPKGRKTRHVLLPSEAIEFFRGLTKDKTGSDRMFRKSNGRIWGGEYRSYFQHARTLAGLPRNLTFHGLRHTYASQLLQDGASLMTVADQLGHANTQTVSSTYGHLTSFRKADEIERCFSTLLQTTERPISTSKNTVIDDPASQSLPVFRHRSDSSWPRSNHSSYSGPLLGALRPETLD